MSRTREAHGPGESTAVVKLGLVGAGPWGRNYIRTMPRISGTRLAAVASRNAHTPELVRQDCRVSSDWNDLLDNSLDGVIIATPPSSHVPIAERFVKRNVAVLIEKPMCTDPGEATRFRDLVAKHSVYAMVGHIHLFSPAYRLLKLLSPSLGSVLAINSAGGRQGPFRADTPALWDWGPHDVSMILDFLDQQPLSVSGRRTLHTAAGQGYADVYDVRMEFPAGVHARATFGNAMAPTRRLEVLHESGALVYDDLADPKLAYRGAAGTQDSGVQSALMASDLSRLPLDCVLDHFCDAIRSGRTNLAALDLAVQVTRVLDEIDRQTIRQESTQ